MSQGCDFSFPPRPSPAALKAAGFGWVFRYLAPAADVAKTLDPGELEELHAAGLAVGLFWESTAGWMLGGATAGRAAAASARSELAARYGSPAPANVAVFFSDDVPTMGTDANRVVQALAAAAEDMGHEKTGFYGPADLMLAASNSARYLFQTSAWSNGVISPLAHFYQNGQRREVDGHAVDVDEILKPEAMNALWLPPGTQGEDVPNQTTFDIYAEGGDLWDTGTRSTLWIGGDPGSHGDTVGAALRIVLLRESGPTVMQPYPVLRGRIVDGRATAGKMTIDIPQPETVYGVCITRPDNKSYHLKGSTK